ncbi:transposable element Tc3 transposase [Trichonephila clavipes]|uniref:Transposable element Tc3 transposase n=1 Tax=Trichonephila clavipes TaxID=2585209 RepID=A0A8X7BNI1_TRICX|nr:transposable element Tc3 transposase [Trichonephila clavipes]
MKMNRYTNAEFVDIHFIYRLAQCPPTFLPSQTGQLLIDPRTGTGPWTRVGDHYPSQRKWRYCCSVVREGYPTRQQLNHQTFAQVHQNLVEHGYFRATIEGTGRSGTALAATFEEGVLHAVDHNLGTSFGLAIHQNDHQARRRFVEWAQNEIAVVPDFHKRILFSDEAHFWLNNYVNKQNCRIWSEANPQVYVETPLHPEKLTVWCALWAGESFFKNDEGHNVTVNGDRYRAMITYFFIPELNNHDVQELCFQQDSATCHTARATIDLLKDTLGDRLISRFGPVNWPPRSCDLTPLDYFLWGYVKSLVYADKPQTLDHLEDNIRRVIADIRPQMLEKVIENWTFRLDYIRASRGSPMPEIIFRM